MNLGHQMNILEKYKTMRKTLRRRLHKLFFPKEDFAIQKILDLSYVYCEKSPNIEQRKVGEDIYRNLIGALE